MSDNLRKLTPPQERYVSLDNRPTKTFYDYLRDLDQLVRDQDEKIKQLETRIEALENP